MRNPRRRRPATVGQNGGVSQDDHPSVAPAVGIERRTGTITAEDVRTGPPKAAHIVKTEPGQSAVAKVTEARIYGYPVEALCGERFVPQQDPKRLPICDTCKEIYELYRTMSDGRLDETPGA
jgi:hypothetical protein